MNADDPRLTAFALNELSEPEISEIAKAVAQSPEAQRAVDEIRELARDLKSGFGELRSNGESRSGFINIRDDPWFWSRARPLAVAALIAVCALVSAIILGTYKIHHDSNRKLEYADIESEESVSNPVSADVIGRADRVVIGELGANESEIRIIETITDRFRIERLKNRLTTKILSKQTRPGHISGSYQLMFLDDAGQIVAAASFYYVPGLGFVLQPSKHGGVAGRHYFIDANKPVLPGDWKADVDYSGYVIPFPDWGECIGYSPAV